VSDPARPRNQIILFYFILLSRQNFKKSILVLKATESVRLAASRGHRLSRPSVSDNDVNNHIIGSFWTPNQLGVHEKTDVMAQTASGRKATADFE
jgi:hypothetical protein